MIFNAGVEDNIPADLLEKFKKEIYEDMEYTILDYIEKISTIGDNVITNRKIYYKQYNSIGVYRYHNTTLIKRESYSNHYIDIDDIENLLELINHKK